MIEILGNHLMTFMNNMLDVSKMLNNMRYYIKRHYFYNILDICLPIYFLFSKRINCHIIQSYNRQKDIVKNYF